MKILTCENEDCRSNRFEIKYIDNSNTLVCFNCGKSYVDHAEKYKKDAEDYEAMFESSRKLKRELEKENSELKEDSKIGYKLMCDHKDEANGLHKENQARLKKNGEMEKRVERAVEFQKGLIESHNGNNTLPFTRTIKILTAEEG